MSSRKLKSIFISVLSVVMSPVLFAMEQEKRPSWLTNWETNQSSWNIVNYEGPLQDMVDLIAEAYIDAGGKDFFTGFNGNPPTIVAMLYGAGYESGMITNGLKKFEEITEEFPALAKEDFLLIFAITENTPLDIANTEEQFYYMTNHYRRTATFKKNDKCQEYFTQLSRVLTSLQKPKTGLTLYRYMHFTKHQELKIGEELDLHFSSCSKHENKTSNFAGENSLGVKIILVDVAPQLCRELVRLTTLGEKEDEVMLLNTCTGKIQSITDSNTPNIALVVVVSVVPKNI